MGRLDLNQIFCLSTWPHIALGALEGYTLHTHMWCVCKGVCMGVCAGCVCRVYVQGCVCTVCVQECARRVFVQGVCARVCVRVCACVHTRMHGKKKHTTYDDINNKAQ